MPPPVCWYFLEGNCRFGDRCRYRHDNGSNNNGSSKNPFVYVKNQHDSSMGRRNLSNEDIREIINRVSEEARQIEYENMWPLTCLSVVRDVHNVPGWEDYSMEELRIAAYSSKAGGVFHEYIKLIDSLKQKARENRKVFLHPGKRAEEIVIEMYEKTSQEPAPTQNTVSNDSFSNFSFASPQKSVFGGPLVTPSGPMFAATSTPLGPSGSFKSHDPAPGLFALAAQGFNKTIPQNTFSQTSINDTAMETAGEFSQPPQDPFQKNIFGAVTQPQPPSVFGTSAPIAPFGAPTTTSPATFSTFGGVSASTTQQTSINVIFTPIDQLTDQEIEQFKAATFTLNKLPLKPPPQELC